MAITFPSNTRDVINDIRNAIGREVYFYTETKVPCSGCSLDPVTDTSTNPFCNICNGVGYIITEHMTTVSAHVTWVGLDSVNWQSGGQIFTGDVGLQIEHTSSNMNLVDNCRYIVVDNKKVEVKKKILRGVPQLNRILLDCMEDET